MTSFPCTVVFDVSLKYCRLAFLLFSFSHLSHRSVSPSLIPFIWFLPFFFSNYLYLFLSIFLCPFPLLSLLSFLASFFLSLFYSYLFSCFVLDVLHRSPSNCSQLGKSGHCWVRVLVRTGLRCGPDSIISATLLAAGNVRRGHALTSHEQWSVLPHIDSSISLRVDYCSLRARYVPVLFPDSIWYTVLYSGWSAGIRICWNSSNLKSVSMSNCLPSQFLPP